ncbi:MAG: ATP-binding protein [Nitrospira sp.]|nr:ATP-binding protein [Nitrospira sp.]MCP9443528.1 ATP-binding protein [Nitrospira sp.]
MTNPMRHSDEQICLRTAFESFDQAARALQGSYAALAARVERMDLELARSNEALRRQLQENEAMRIHLDGILESLSTGVLVVDETGVITRSNRQAARLLGSTDVELRGRPAAVVLESMGLVLDDRPQRVGQAMVTVAESPLKIQSGDRAGKLILIQDVSRLYQLEEQVQRTDRLAAMGEMIGRIAHEIRNPLGSVELFASLLRNDLSDRPAARQYAEQISQAVHAMDRLLANLLAYMKPTRPVRAWHAAEPLILDALSLAAHAIAHVRADVRLDLDPAIPAIWCHEERMKQALLNLIVNAAQAMPNGGILTIALKPDESHGLGTRAVRLTVSDSGVGIDPAHRSRLFDPFFTTKAEGTGLGLAIVHSIVDAHQGRIDVDSTVGRGSSFSIVLPHPSASFSADRSPDDEKEKKGKGGVVEEEIGEPILVEDVSHD